MFDESKLVNAIKNIVSQLTSNGARISYEDGYVYDASSYLISAYLNGDEVTPLTGIIPPAGHYLGSGDYIQVAINEQGTAWVSRVKDTQLYSPLAIDSVRGRLLIGDGSTGVSNYAGAYGNVLYSGGSGASAYWGPRPTSGIGLTDGDKGDITVASSGTSWTIDNDVVSYAKMQNVSATDKLLGRATAGAGDVEEITLTAAGRALIDDASATAQLATLGFQTARVYSGGALASATGVDVTVTWGTAFADTNYTVTATIVGTNSSNLARVGIAIRSVSNSGCVVRIYNDHTASVTVGDIHLIAIHD